MLEIVICVAYCMVMAAMFRISGKCKWALLGVESVSEFGLRISDQALSGYTVCKLWVVCNCK